MPFSAISARSAIGFLRDRPWQSEMLIPSIDLQNGHVVQLVQGERLAIEAPSPEPWIERFSRFPRVQLIDLDAARGRGDNAALVAEICGRLPCRVGGGIRSVQRAQAVLALGAHAVIASSALFRDGAVDVVFARALAEAIGRDRVIAAVDSRGGQVVIHGWKTPLPITAVDAVRALEPFCAEFLYTHVDTEGLMQGTDLAAIMAVRQATSRRVTAAGGITTWDEIDRLDAAGVDAVVGMAIYTGQLPLDR
jgi:phosphoribosylformimino-5-aminoimidazole carboxamide ribotide isomerase